MLRLLIIFLCAGALVWLVVYGLQGQNKEDASPPSLDQISLNSINLNNPAPSQTSAVAKKTSFMQPFPLTIDSHKTYSASLVTTAGTIVISLDAAMTPNTVNNFVSLARAHFYDGTIFHRVVKGFMIQGGDPKGDGTGGPGYRFPDEPFTGDYTRGTVAMANAGPNTNGSQFFIVQQDTPLPKKYVIFGHVTSGLDVMDTIADAPVTVGPSGEKSRPIDPVVVNSVTIEEK